MATRHHPARRTETRRPAPRPEPTHTPAPRTRRASRTIARTQATPSQIAAMARAEATRPIDGAGRDEADRIGIPHSRVDEARLGAADRARDAAQAREDAFWRGLEAIDEQTRLGRWHFASAAETRRCPQSARR